MNNTADEQFTVTEWVARSRKKKLDRRIIGILCVTLGVTVDSNANGVGAGQVAPNCALTPVGDSGRYDLHQLQGKVVYVDFWASWCSSCARSFPFLNTLHRELQDRGLHVLGINLDEKPEDAQAFLDKHPANFSVAFDAGGQCPQDFGVKAMPSSYLIDRKGTIRHVHLGFRRGEAEEIRVVVEQLLAESFADK